MPSAIGPYDGRKARRKRCDPCVKRQIKCHGGTPCENCRRTNRQCDMATKKTRENLVFIHPQSTIQRDEGFDASKAVQWVCPSYTPVYAKQSELYLPYFFKNFLPQNIFTSRNSPAGGDLLAMSKSSPALKDALDAVAALHSQTVWPSISSEDDAKARKVDAIRAYTRSVRWVRQEIATGRFMEDYSALWITFCLGLFELMHDSTGTNWLSHFLHGTSTMLRLQKPEALTSPNLDNARRRSFFLATRIFEISRSLIFSSFSFLSTEEWSTALKRLWEGEGALLWHPKEALFDILPHCAKLSIRAANFCANAPQLSTKEQHTLAKSFAQEGFALQTSLQQWLANTSSWVKTVHERTSSSTIPSELDVDSLIGYIYFHGISIYLSGTYDYHPYWTCNDAPILTQDMINWHVAEILRLSHEILAENVASILLFFPLRVAGARAGDEESRSNIRSLLHTIALRGFVVADAFTIDLSELWSRKDKSLRKDA